MTAKQGNEEWEKGPGPGSHPRLEGASSCWKEVGVLVSSGLSWATQACDWMALETSRQTPATEKPLTHLNIIMLMVSLGRAICDYQ